MTPFQLGILGCVALLILLTSSMPVGFAMALIGAVGFAIVKSSPGPALIMVTTTLYETLSMHSLTVIPLFVLMGQIAFHAGISRRLFQTAYRWVGPLPGGLAMATVWACSGFGAICGSGPATSATMAAVALPEMKRYKYDMELGTGSVAAGGSLGMLIPPSVVFICYAILTEQSIGKLFIAGIAPGILISVLFCLTIYIKCKRQPHMGPPAPSTTWVGKFASLGGVAETLLLFLLVMGGMFLGYFTPTEAAAIGAAGTLLVPVGRSLIMALAAAVPAAFVPALRAQPAWRALPRALCRTASMTWALFVPMLKQHFAWKVLSRALQETARTTCMVLIIVAGARIFGKFLTITNIPTELASAVAELPLPAWGIMAVIILFYLVGGCFVDALALLLLTVPIFAPVVEGLHYDLIWFGVIIVVVTQMGVISPPVGVCVYVVSGIERDVPLQTVFKGALPFLAALIVAAAILVAFPQISLFLPGLMR